MPETRTVKFRGHDAEVIDNQTLRLSDGEEIKIDNERERDMVWDQLYHIRKPPLWAAGT